MSSFSSIKPRSRDDESRLPSPNGAPCESPGIALVLGRKTMASPRREVNFSLVGSAGPGFHTWPSGHIPQDTAAKLLFRIRPPAKKTFGEAFGAATVAGSAGPGFHTWPSGHISQDTAAKPLLRIRPPGKKTFGEAFGAATGVSDPRLQKSRGARATTPGPYRYETTTQVS